VTSGGCQASQRAGEAPEPCEILGPAALPGTLNKIHNPDLALISVTKLHSSPQTCDRERTNRPSAAKGVGN
jgi:hypothetical protein